MTNEPSAPTRSRSLGAVVYPPEGRPEALLAAFAAGLTARGFRLDVDLVVLESGTDDRDLRAALARGLPLLTAVPAAEIGAWIAATGGDGVLLMPTEPALWRWWGAGRLYQDLARGVPDHPAGRVVIGVNFTLVEGPDGIGLAQTPERVGAGCTHVPGLLGGTLRQLAARVDSWNPFDLAVGIAACNAHYNRFDLAAEAVNGLDVLAGERRVVVIGAFPGIAERLPGAQVIERRPAAGEFPEEAAEWLLPEADAVVITSSALANRSLPRLLTLAERARIVLVGPGAPLTPRLFDYGIEALAGVVVEDGDGLVRAVAAGAGARAIKRHCRSATLRRPGGG